MAAEDLDGVNRIVIGHRHKIHPAPFQCLVDVLRSAVALTVDPVQKRHCAHAGVHRVDVQIAFHAFLYQACVTVSLRFEQHYKNI